MSEEKLFAIRSPGRTIVKGMVVGRCATCRHAEPARHDLLAVNHALTLLCGKMVNDSSSLAAGRVNPEWGLPASVLVSPDFGCVMYEAKE